MNSLQILKAYGRLPLVSLSHVKLAKVSIDQSNEAATIECGCPDAADRDIADAAVDEIMAGLDCSEACAKDLKSLHAKMISAEATGRGSYPSGCNPEYPGMHAVAYFDDPTSRPSHLRRKMTDDEFQSIIDAKVWGTSGDPQGTPFTMAQLKAAWGESEMGDVVNVFCEEAYRRWGVIMYRVDTGPDGQHNIHVSYPTISGSTIGVGWFPDSSPCPGDHVNLHIDKTYTNGFQHQVGVKCHEFGHCLKGPHQFENQDEHQEPLSYEYRNHLFVGYSDGSAVFGLPVAPSTKLWKELYGGVPVGKPWKGLFESQPPVPPTGSEYKTVIDLSGRQFDLTIKSQDGKPMDRSRNGKATIDMGNFKHLIRIDPKL